MAVASVNGVLMQPLLPNLDKHQVYAIGLLIPVLCISISAYVSDGPDPVSNYIVMIASICFGGTFILVNGFSIQKLVGCVFVYVPVMFVCTFIAIFMIDCSKGYCL